MANAHRLSKKFNLVGSTAFAGTIISAAALQFWLHKYGGAESLVRTLNNVQSFISFTSISVAPVERINILLTLTLLNGARATLFAFYYAGLEIPPAIGLGVGTFYQIITTIATMSTRSVSAPVGLLDYLGIGLYALGTFLLVGSEIQRKWFKDDPHNQGKPYVGGLFRLAQHINYFGDTVIWVGIACISRNWYAAFVPAFMAAGFIGVHIPSLQIYLKEKYPNYSQLTRNTAKYIPFVY